MHVQPPFISCIKEQNLTSRSKGFLSQDAKQIAPWLLLFFYVNKHVSLSCSLCGSKEQNESELAVVMKCTH